MVNSLSHADVKPQSRPWMSKQKDLYNLPEDIFDDYEMNTFENGEEQVKWRCGCCLGDLATLLTYGDVYWCESPKTILNAIWAIGALNELDKQIAMGWGDKFDDLDANIKEKIIAHDYNLVKQHFSNYKKGTCLIGTDLPADQF